MTEETEVKKEKKLGNWYLRKGIEGWSAGTQVQILSHSSRMGEGYAACRILAGDRPVFSIPKDYLVRRRARS